MEEETKKEDESVGKKILFLHAGCETKGVIIQYKPDGFSNQYLYKAIDSKGIKYFITKLNFISY